MENQCPSLCPSMILQIMQLAFVEQLEFRQDQTSELDICLGDIL